jgi:hypothetical protein
MYWFKLYISEECLFKKKKKKEEEEEFSIVCALPSTHSHKKRKNCQTLAKHNK